MRISRLIIFYLLTAAALSALAVYTVCTQNRFGCYLTLLLLLLTLCGTSRFVLLPLRKTEDMVSTMTVHAYDGLCLDHQIEILLDRNEQMIKQEYDLQMLRKQAELNALQSQINPHFLYNTLDSIRGCALMADMDEIADMTEALSTFFRYTISSTGAPVTLEDEVENVRNYIAIQHFRFGDRIRLTVEIDDPLLLECRMPKMVLQPVVENAVLHGLEKTSRHGLILIRATAADEQLILTVQDNGIGMTDEEMRRINDRLDHPDRSVPTGSARHTGIALTNVCQRIRLRYGLECGMHVFSTPDVGTEVSISLPFDLGEEEDYL